MKQWAIGFCGMLIIACGGSGTAGEEPILPGGKADSFGFEYGIYSNPDFDWEDGQPLMIAFHEVREGVPDNFAGHFDYSLFNGETEAAEHISGVFKLYRYAGRLRIRFQSYDGEDLGRYDWSAESRRFELDGTTFGRINPSSRPEVRRQCYAFDVLEYEFDESFTVGEYPSVDVETDELGRPVVYFGCTEFDSDEAQIDVLTSETGDFEATVTASWGTIYQVRIPHEEPTRGEVLYGEEGEDLQLMARLVCFPDAGQQSPSYPQERQTFVEYTPANTEPIKVLFLDADGTLRVSKSGAPSANSADDVVLLPLVADTVAEYAANGYLVAIVSNQGGVSHGYVTHDIASGALSYISQLVAEKGGQIHYFDYAEAYDEYRKPSTGMAQRLAGILEDTYGQTIDWENSIMVGDAGWKKDVDLEPDGSMGIDFSNSDRFFAANVRTEYECSEQGFPYFHPRDFFGWIHYGIKRFDSQEEVEAFQLEYGIH